MVHNRYGNKVPSTQLSKEAANQIVVEYIKGWKSTEKIEVLLVEMQDNCGVVRET